jgi:hypothetical protein
VLGEWKLKVIRCSDENWERLSKGKLAKKKLGGKKN